MRLTRKPLSKSGKSRVQYLNRCWDVSNLLKGQPVKGGCGGKGDCLPVAHSQAVENPRFAAFFPRGLGSARTYTSSVRTCVAGVLTLCIMAASAMPEPAFSQAAEFPKTPGGIFGGTPELPDKSQPLQLQGDELLYDTKKNRVTARGNVEIYFNGYTLTAQEVIYDQSARTLTASGNAIIKDPNGNVTRGELLTLTDDFRDAFAQSLSVTSADNTRITARNAIRRDGEITVFNDGKFTPCSSDPGRPALWCIGASRITHNQATKTISYQDARFEFLGVPVFYLPYFEHADSTEKRRSGFLVPSVSQSSTLGFSVETPYHFALDPSYDLLFNPRYMSEQGVLWQGMWRHKLRNGQYSVSVAALDQKPDPKLGTDFLADGWRGSVETHGEFSLSSWWSFGWNAVVESDDSFRRAYSLDSNLQTDRVNSVYLRGMSDRSYFSVVGYHFGGLLVSDDPRAEAIVHPVIDWNYVSNTSVLGGELSANANVLALSRSDGSVAAGDPDGVDSNHIVAEVNWRRKLIDSLGQVWTPFASLRGDAYHFANQPYPDNPTVLQPDDTVTRGMATVGMTYAYPFVTNSNWASHVIEPIGQIIVRPAKVRQRNLPDEDAKSLVLDDTLLFDTDKFSGYDRLETGTRANVGFQYTFQAYNGGYARAIVGQSFHLAGDNAYNNPAQELDKNVGTSTVFSAATGLETDRSDYVAGLYLAPNSNFRLIAQSRFDNENLQLRRQDLFAYANFGPFAAQATYAYNRNSTSTGIISPQQDVSASLGIKLTDFWSVYSTIRYDIDDNFLLSDTVELKYADECFVLAVSYGEQHTLSSGQETDRTVSVRFALKHIGEFNSGSTDLNSINFINQDK